MAICPVCLNKIEKVYQHSGINTVFCCKKCYYINKDRIDELMKAKELRYVSRF